MSFIRNTITATFVNMSLFLICRESQTNQLPKVTPHPTRSIPSQIVKPVSIPNPISPITIQAIKSNINSGFDKEKTKEFIFELNHDSYSKRAEATKGLETIAFSLQSEGLNNFFSYLLDEAAKINPPERERRLDHLIKKIVGKKSVSLAGYEKASQNVFKYLAKNSDYPVKIKLLFNKGFTDEDSMNLILSDLPDDVTQHLVSVTNNSRVFDILRKTGRAEKINFDRYLAKNQYLDKKQMEEFFNSENYYFKAGIAGNKGATEDLLEKSATDKDSSIRATAAANKSITKRIYEKIAKNEKEHQVLFNLACNKSVPKELREQLFQVLVKNADYQHIREQLAKCKDMSAELLKELLQDKDKYVREAAYANKNLPKEFLKYDKGLSYAALAGIAANENTQPELIEELSEHKDPYIRACAAGNKNNTARALKKLKKLAREENGYVRMVLAGNESITRETLIELAFDIDPGVRYSTIYNPNMFLELLIEMAQNDRSNYIRGVARLVLSKHHADYLINIINSNLN